MSKKTTRCTTCRAEFTDGECAGATACPSCGTTGIPMLIADDVDVRINWHELRILGMWASNYANEHCELSGRKALAAILHGVACQHPERAMRSPLTLAGELGQLRQAIADGEIPASSLETNVRDLLDESEG